MNGTISEAGKRNETDYIVSQMPSYSFGLARMPVPKMVKNGFNSD
jgi:hypothetical protein